MSKIRKLALALLDDDYGITAEAYETLLAMMKESGDCGDIIANVEATDDRFYLPVAEALKEN